MSLYDLLWSTDKNSKFSKKNLLNHGLTTFYVVLIRNFTDAGTLLSERTPIYHILEPNRLWDLIYLFGPWIVWFLYGIKSIWGPSAVLTCSILDLGLTLYLLYFALLTSSWLPLGTFATPGSSLGVWVLNLNIVECGLQTARSKNVWVPWHPCQREPCTLRKLASMK